LEKDIAGFTAWSSSRDPSHVFLLLETIYSAFDKLAAHHKVFKVETIGT
jgi:class 3 adenylate cyclase